MKKRISWAMVAAAGILLASCGQVSYKKTKGGMPYKLFASAKGTAVDTANFMRVQITQKVNDSVLLSTYANLPFYLQAGNQSHPYDVSELWLTLKEGDSLVTVQALDTFINRNPRGVPPQFKKGDLLHSTFKIEKVFATEEAYRDDEKKTREDYTQKEVKEIGDYLAKKNIKATKTKSGAFVEIIQPGTGPLIDSGKLAMSLYKGISFSGKVFDTNIDSAFGHPGAIPFTIGIAGQPGGLTAGFDESMQMLQKGSKARFYIPSMLAYGAQPPSPDIKPFEHLIFEVEVLDVMQGKEAPALPGRPKLDIGKATN